MSEIQHNSEVVTKPVQKVKEPKRFKIVIMNDDYTTMEFVVYILQTVFHKPESEAHALMMAIHQNGSGIAGVYSFEIAEMKVALVTQIAREHEYPLRCFMEEE